MAENAIFGITNSRACINKKGIYFDTGPTEINMQAILKRGLSFAMHFFCAMIIALSTHSIQSKLITLCTPLLNDVVRSHHHLSWMLLSLFERSNDQTTTQNNSIDCIWITFPEMCHRWDLWLDWIANFRLEFASKNSIRIFVEVCFHSILFKRNGNSNTWVQIWQSHLKIVVDLDKFSFSRRFTVATQNHIVPKNELRDWINFEKQQQFNTEAKKLTN